MSECTTSISEIPAAHAPTRRWIVGWSLRFMTCGIVLSMTLVNVEVSIVGTSLVSIVNDLNGFNQSGLIVAAYLASYTSLLIIWCKVSDIFGRKPTMMTAQLIFAAFSGGCAATQSMTQLIVCRALQGVGAAGCQALGILMIYEMVPPSNYPLYGAIVSVSAAVGSLTGPVIGGGLSEYSTWRWVFLINVPATSFALLVLLLSVPATFPYPTKESSRNLIQPAKLAKLDLGGSFLLLLGTYCLVTSLLVSGTSFAWSSATSVVLFALAGVSCIFFLLLEKYVTQDDWKTEPLFPWRFLFNRAWMGALLSSFFSGAPYSVLVVILPQRFQVVNGLSSLDAGVRLIPFGAFVSFGMIIVSAISAKSRIPPIYLIAVGSVLQLVGITPMAYLPTTTKLVTSIYGFQVLTGLGIGFTFGIAVLLPPLLVEKRDLSVATGALMQLRILGGALGLSAGSGIANNYLKSHLRAVRASESLSFLIQSFQQGSFSSEDRVEIQKAFAESFSLQAKVLIGFAAAQLLALALLWKRPQILLLHQMQQDGAQKAEDEK